MDDNEYISIPSLNLKEGYQILIRSGNSRTTIKVLDKSEKLKQEWKFDYSFNENSCVVFLEIISVFSGMDLEILTKIHNSVASVFICELINKKES